MMNNEIWKHIPKLPHNYEVSNLGNVRKHCVGDVYREVHQTVSNGLYHISVEGKQFPVHRLVASAFITTSQDTSKLFVRHLNGDKFLEDIYSLPV